MDKHTDYPHLDKYNKLLKYANVKRKVVETIDDITNSLPYKNKSLLRKYNTHIGQRKLILSEIQFLSSVDDEYVVYAGSAPGNKNYFLAQLFPKKKFILVDPNKFQIYVDGKSHRQMKHEDIIFISSGYPHRAREYNGMDDVEYIKNSKERIFIYEEFMTDELANRFKILSPCFISDIRSNVSGVGYPTDFDIYWNSSMMYNWVRIMESTCLLKIRMPYLDGSKIEKGYEKDFETSKQFGINFLQDMKDRKFRMPISSLYIQAWAPSTSTELRMRIDKKNLTTVKEYNIREIEDKMFYFNRIGRSLVMRYNIYSDGKDICHCNDCALECKIWEDYFKNKASKTSAKGTAILKPTIKNVRAFFYYLSHYLKRPVNHVLQVFNTMRYKLTPSEIKKLDERVERDTKRKQAYTKSKLKDRGNKGR